MAQLKRSDIDAKYKWKLEAIVDGDNAWEQLFKDTEKLVEPLGAFAGKLSDADAVAACLAAESEVSRNIERLYVYARMRRDEDSTVSLYQGLADRAMGLYVKAGAVSAYVVPELSALPQAALEKIAADPRLKDYDRFFYSIIRQKEHILTDKEESLLALGGEVSSSFSQIFAMMDNADHSFPTITDENGKRVKITHSTYSVMLQKRSQALRRKAYNAYYRPYKAKINTLAAVYAAVVKKDVYHMRARKFGSSLEAALFNEEVDASVYRNLLKTVEGGLPALHDYMALRKRVSGLEKLCMHDMHFPIFDKADIALSYEDAYKLVKEGLKPLGKDYAALLDEAYNSGWIDVFENKGKRSGAYSWGTYDAHPYVLLNHEKTTHGIFTIAHELGHAMHSYFSNRAQPYEGGKANYTIFVAEVASTVNEVLLLKHIVAQNEDENVRKFLLSYYLDMFRTTVFRQTQFSEFEAKAHEMAESGQPLTHEALSEFYLGLNKKYYGPAVTYDKNISMEWARIPHFYNSPFYVYKYATGLISAVNIAGKILEEGGEMVADYKKFLSSGGSSDPVSLLRLARVDLGSPQPFEFAMREFEDTLSKLASLTE